MKSLGLTFSVAALREDKIPQGLVPRSLEDEGFYIGKPPLVEQTRISVMENRLLKSEKEVHLLHNLPPFFQDENLWF